MRGPRLQVASAAWVADERSAALQMLHSEVDEFSYSARNEVDWLNEHMGGIFNENEINFAEAFKTPGKLRGRTPHNIRPAAALESRVPLSNVFVAHPNTSSPSKSDRFLGVPKPQIQSAQNTTRHASPCKPVSPTRQQHKVVSAASQDSGYHDSHDTGFTTSASIATEDCPCSDIASHHVPAEALKESRKAANAIFDAISASDTAFEATPLLSGLQQGNTENDAGSNTTPFLSQDLTQQVTNILDSDSQPCHAVEKQALNGSRSPSDGSSPIRPVVRKSSLNFASLPAREPLTAGKSFGARVSRTSHIDHLSMSHYNRPTGGKSLGNVAKSESEEDNLETAMPNPTRKGYKPGLVK
ncbi:hypothetical protein CDD81_2750 [Ophiocordyceps australis]|uniref:Uncharacterized protein n=1 Tax=Ophiocordyceps australis TaxID=1399860 RepID=A0A2C5XK05_9HYPO|nr:hypothetical protein CDD81_2750 [Ophiocordyceps australis]